MPTLPRLHADVFFGATDKPLPDWREHATDDEDDEDDDLDEDELRALVSMLGFDLRDEGDDSAADPDDEDGDGMTLEMASAPDPWAAYKGQRGARKGQVGWKHSETGRVVWGAKPTSRPSRPTVEEAHKHISGIKGKATAQHVKDVADKLMHMRVADIQELKKRLGVRASGAKAELVRKVTERAFAGAKTAKVATKSPAKPPQKKVSRQTTGRGLQQDLADLTAKGATANELADYADTHARAEKAFARYAKGKDYADWQSGDVGRARMQRIRQSIQKREDDRTRPVRAATMPKVSTLEEVKSLMTQAKSEASVDPFLAPRKVIQDIMVANGTDQGDVRTHGMANAERMQGMEIEGTLFRWGTSQHATESAAETLGYLALLGKDMPATLWTANKHVTFCSQRNSQDEFWAKQYKNPEFMSAATGGDGGICVYARGVTRGTLTHESGHNLAKQVWGQTDPPTESNYGAAQGVEGPVSEYGANSQSEDFAEACRMYSSPSERDRLRIDFPLKYAALQQLLEK